MPHFGPFGVNWVGIWVGVFRGAEVSARPSGSARPGGSARNPNLVRGLFSSSADWPPLYLQHRPNRGGVLSQPARKACGAIGTLHQLGGQGVIRQLDATRTFTGVVLLYFPERCRFSR
jgi:hypothetical protein